MDCIETRADKRGTRIRRRRQCSSCHERFTTLEKVVRNEADVTLAATHYSDDIQDAFFALSSKVADLGRKLEVQSALLKDHSSKYVGCQDRRKAAAEAILRELREETEVQP